MKRYALSPNPIFWSLQGEGRLRGDPMAFVRLAGCSVGCAECDTDYRVDSRAFVPEIIERVRAVTPEGIERPWVWVTGGEPTDHDLYPLLTALKGAGYRTAVASSGVRVVSESLLIDWLSISPHSGNLQQNRGNEIKLVHRLGDLALEEWVRRFESGLEFDHRYVQPLSVQGRENAASLAHCLRFVQAHPTWSLSRQDHVHWGVA